MGGTCQQPERSKSKGSTTFTLRSRALSALLSLSKQAGRGKLSWEFLVLYSSSLTNPVLNKMSFQISTTTAINLQNKLEWSSPKSRSVKSFNFCTDKRALLLALAQRSHYGGFMVVLQFLTSSHLVLCSAESVHG